MKGYLDKGALVPNEVTFDVLKNRISQPDCKKGFILDGFPRSLDQAKMLSQVTDIDAVISVELGFEELEKGLFQEELAQNVATLTMQIMKVSPDIAENVAQNCFSVMTINLRQ